MDSEEDGRLAPIRSFALTGFRLDPEGWRAFVGQEENTVTLESFCSSHDHGQLFLHRGPGSGLRAGLSFPEGVQTKVLWLSKTVRDPLTKDNARARVRMQELRGGDALGCLVSLTQEVSVPLLSDRGGGAPGVSESALRILERQRNAAQVMKAQVEGHTFLPQPDALRPHGNGYRDDGHDKQEPLGEGGRHDDGLQGELVDVKLLHACEGTVVEWAELVSEFLQQDWSKPVLEGLRPLPSEEFSFWRSRLQNLLFLQNQLTGARAQQVAAIIQAGESIYWATLRDIYRDVQEGLEEAQDVVQHLTPLQQQLQQLEELEFRQLRDHMTPVMEQVRLLWTRSRFYCKPCRVVVLLQEFCNLLIHQSRKFLRGQEVIRSLASDPGPVLNDVRLVIRTLKTLKEAYAQTSSLLDTQNQNQDPSAPGWDFPSQLVFLHLDRFLERLLSVQEALLLGLQVTRLAQTVVAGGGGRMWTEAVQKLSHDFLLHLELLQGGGGDPTDPQDQDFQQNLDLLQTRVLDLEQQLVSVLSRALTDCSQASSVAKLVRMFGFVLARPRVRDRLQAQLGRVLEMVRLDLEQTEVLFQRNRARLHRFCRFGPAPAAGLGWVQTLQQRALEALRAFGAVQHLCVDPGQARLVLARLGRVLELLLGLRGALRADWSLQLDSDCSLVLDHVLLEGGGPGPLRVGCLHKVEEVLRAFRCVRRGGGVELRPHAARLLARRDDITQSCLRLGHMVSCYNQVVSGALQVELPVIQEQLLELDRKLAPLKKGTWSSKGVQQEQTEGVLRVFSSVQEARANMATMTRITQEWAGLDLLQRAGDSLLRGGVTELTCSRLREDGEQLLRLAQVNRSLYGAEEASQAWRDYLDHVDDQVQEGLFLLLLRALHFLCSSMSPQAGGALLAVSLRLRAEGSVFEPAVGGGLLEATIAQVYAAAALPRISASRHGNYQEALQQRPELCSLQQEVLRELQQVSQEAELLRAGLERHAHLWRTDRENAFREFLTYSRQLGPEEQDPAEAPPTLRDFQREIQQLHALAEEASHLDDVIHLRGWLQVELRAFRASLLALIHSWKQMYTDHLLERVSSSLQQVTRRGAQEEESRSSLPVTDAILLLEAVDVQLPEHLAAQLQC